MPGKSCGKEWHGLQVSGANVIKLLKSIKETGAVAAGVKDPVWKYKWVQNNEPAVFSRTYKWLDVKEFLSITMVDAAAKIAAIVGAQPGRFNYFAELETAGKGLEWVKDHFALDEIGIYLQKVPAKKERVPRRRNRIMC